MLALGLNELETLAQQSSLFSCEYFAQLAFRHKDYLGDPQLPLKGAVLQDVNRLGGRLRL